MRFPNSQKPDFRISKHFLEEKDWEGKEGFIQEEYNRPTETKFRVRRLAFFRILVIVCFLILGWRVFSLQILAGESYRREAEGNRIRTFGITASRGIIYDRKGRLLVRNIPSFQVVFVPADLPQESSEREELITILADVIGKEAAEIAQIFNAVPSDSYDPEILIRSLNRDQALVLDAKLHSLPGINLVKVPIREYIEGELVAHILGYTGKISPEEYEEKKNRDYFLTDYVGKQGVEYFYEEELRGKSGKEVVEIDSKGKIEKILGLESPLNGSSLELTLDIDLQRKLSQEIKAMMEKAGSQKAAAVALDPQTGRILALVSFPTYDNNLFAQGVSQEDFDRLTQDPNKPLFNRPIGGEYPPGSTIKPLIAAAALEEKIIGPKRSLNCPGSLIYHGWAGTVWTFKDWKAHGITDIRKAIAESCDVFFYALGGGSESHQISGLGIEKIKSWAMIFGLNSLLGVDLPGEAGGLIPDKQWKEKTKGERWYIGDTYHASIGQGDISVTPLQLTNYIAAIANRGTLYKPKIAYKIISEITEEQREIEPEVIRKDFVSLGNLEIVRQGMRDTVIYGSGRALASLPVEAAGKTGTAQFAGGGDKTHAWFTCFAPYDQPEIVLTVLIEGGGDGDKVAVPVANNVLHWYFTNRD